MIFLRCAFLATKNCVAALAHPLWSGNSNVRPKKALSRKRLGTERWGLQDVLAIWHVRLVFGSFKRTVEIKTDV